MCLLAAATNIAAAAAAAAATAVRPGTRYIQSPMEDLPLPDNSLDAVVCIYCFHEMPEAARFAAAKEWCR
jgi:ubiquinone/menaquinone biosynthesis C-methylase UbiE